MIGDLEAGLKGWETLDAEEKEFICFRRFLGTDKATCEARNIPMSKLRRWRKWHSDFSRLEQYILEQPLILANLLFDDLVPIAAFRLYRSLTSGDERTAESAARTVFKVKGILGDEQKGGTKVVVINLPFERKQIDGSTDYRLIEGVPASLGPENTPRVIEEDKGS